MGQAIHPDAAPLDDGAGYRCELTQRGERLLIAFGGIAGTNDEPTFEFSRTARDVATQRIMLRDHERSWYHRGIRQVGTTIAEIETWLESRIHEAAPERIVMTGASAGGYAAMLFGHRLGAATVHAFAPQTFIDPDLRSRHHEPRWDAETASLIQSGRYDARFGDIARLLTETPPANPEIEYHVWYSSQDEPDAVHAAHIADVPRVTLHHIPEGWHETARWLRSRGYLAEILAASLEGRAVPDVPEETSPVLLTRPSRRFLLRRRWRLFKQRHRGTGQRTY